MRSPHRAFPLRQSLLRTPWWYTISGLSQLSISRTGFRAAVSVAFSFPCQFSSGYAYLYRPVDDDVRRKQHGVDRVVLCQVVQTLAVASRLPEMACPAGNTNILFQDCSWSFGTQWNIYVIKPGTLGSACDVNSRRRQAKLWHRTKRMPVL